MTWNLPWRKQPRQTEHKARSIITTGADKCVSCGLCVPLCPTWQVSHNEADAPRGRIMMMAQIGAGNSPANADYYLDACLGCARCEEVCPNDVPYMNMLPMAKAVLQVKHTMLVQLLEHLALWRRGGLVLSGMFASARLARMLGLGKLLPESLASAVSHVAHPAPTVLPRPPKATSKKAIEVSMFSGCFSQALHKPILDAATLLLTVTGHNVKIPSQQTCCGAIAHHAGDLHSSEACAKSNLLAFTASTVVATVATGCAAKLASTELSGKVVDAGLLVSNNLARLKFRPAPKLSVLVHTPCSQRRLVGNASWVGKLLGHIPRLKVIPATDHIACCGAGGLTYLEHPHTGNTLADRKIAAWKNQFDKEAIVLTTNHGCGWHLAAAAKRAGIKLQVSHPLEFASQYLDRKNI